MSFEFIKLVPTTIKSAPWSLSFNEIGRSIPPSTSIKKLPYNADKFSIFSKVLLINFCPPKPALTLIIKTRSI